MTPRRIPHTVVFPFGYRVGVRQVSRAELRAMDDDDDTDDLDAWFDGDARVIYIDRSLPIRRRRYLLTHELSHAWADWQHYCLDIGVARP